MKIGQCPSFTPSCREKSGHHFSVFLPNNWAIGFFFLYWKTWEIIEFSQKVKFCSNSQSGIENFKVCINCWLFTPLDYKLLIVVSRKISLWYLLYLMVQWCCSQELIRQGYILKSFLNLQIKPAFLVFFACMSNTHKFCDA